MADHKVNVTVEAKDKATGVIKGVGGAVDGLGNKFKTFGTAVKAFFLSPVGLMISAAASLGLAFKKASSEAAEQEAALNKLSAAMRNNKTFTDGAFNSAINYANELQNTTTIADEVAVSAMAMINSLTRLTGDGLNRATMAAADLSAGLGVDLESAAQLLSKSIAGNVNALGRYGITIKGAAGSSERLDSAIKSITEKFGGRATAETKTFNGAVIMLKNSTSELFEAIGTKENSVLVPFINSLTKAINKLRQLSGAQTLPEIEEEIKKGSKKLDEMLNANLEKTAGFMILQNRMKVLEMQKSGMIQQQGYDKQQQIAADYRAKQDSIEKEASEKKKTNTEKAAEEKKKKDQEDAEYYKKWHQDLNNNILDQDDKAREEKANKQKKEFEDMLGMYEMFGSSMTEIMGKSGDDQAKAFGNAVRNMLVKIIDMWMQAEIGKAFTTAPMTFGATLAALGPIVGAAAAAKGALSAITFAQGGIVPGNSTTGDRVPARVNSGEMILNKSQQENMFRMLNGSGGGGNMTVTLMLDKKILAREIINLQKQNEKGLI